MEQANPKTNTHVMVDIETYDITPSAIILSIGACVITDTTQSFYLELNPNTQYERTLSLDTQIWWAKQGNPPIHGVVDLAQGLQQFASWLDKLQDPPVIWCKGTDFDVAILTHAYKQLDINIPWKYTNVRDCRTVFKLAQYQPKPANHNALDDAIRQSESLLSCLSFLGVKLA